MSEEEILQKAKDFIIFMDDVIKNHLDYDYEENITAYEDKALVQGLLDLYQKEKEKNKKLEARKYMLNAETGEVTAIPIDNNYISKDKIREKIDYLLKRYDTEEDYCSYEVIISILQSLLKESESNDI